MENSKEIQKAEITKDVNKKVTDAVVEICEKFQYEIMRCVNCPILLECKYPKKRLEKLKAEAEKMAQDVYDEELELDSSAENTIRAQQKRDQVYKNYIQDNSYKELKNDRCLFERKEILTALQKFVDAGYDITDPRSYVIINELVSNLLTSGRANKAFTNLGLILRKDTPAGPIYYQNPLLKAKLEFSRLIVDTTEALDRILKSDQSQAQEKNFTDHLIRKLKLREKKKANIIDGITSEVLED